VRSAGFLEVGVAYVEFALSHPAHFQVKRDDPVAVF
jgi:hypothetical protein